MKRIKERLERGRQVPKSRSSPLVVKVPVMRMLVSGYSSRIAFLVPPLDTLDEVAVGAV